MKRRIQRGALTAATVATDLLFAVGFCTGSRRVASVADGLDKLIVRRWR